MEIFSVFFLVFYEHIYLTHREMNHQVVPCKHLLDTIHVGYHVSAVY